MLKKLFKYQERLQQSHTIEYKRYLYKTLDFENKMIGIFGARGVGKTLFYFNI
jgi:predicted AAA+ superfamily ATPase